MRGRSTIFRGVHDITSPISIYVTYDLTCEVKASPYAAIDGISL